MTIDRTPSSTSRHQIVTARFGDRILFCIVVPDFEIAAGRWDWLIERGA